MSPAVMRAVYFDLTEDATASTGCSPEVRGSTHEVVHQESFLRSAPTCGTWTRIHNKIWNGCATLWFNVWWVLSRKPWPTFLVQKNFELTDRPCLFSRWRPETGNFLVWPCKKFYHKRIFSELGACPGSNESKGNSTCKEEIQKKYKNTKKIVTTEKFMRLIYNSIMWYRVISSFGSTSTRPTVSVRCELALQILKSMLHDITWSHCGSISWISRLQRFFFLARVVFLSPMLTFVKGMG